jgi:hypothetical protein
MGLNHPIGLTYPSTAMKCRTGSDSGAHRCIPGRWSWWSWHADFFACVPNREWRWVWGAVVFASRPIADITAIHYVKTGEFSCMKPIHRNVTGLATLTNPGGRSSDNVGADRQVCKSRFCAPPGVCRYSHPTGESACRVGTKSKWSVISAVAGCETNTDSPKVSRKSFAEVLSLKCCKSLCEETCWCVAVDFFDDSGWCNMFTQQCKTPSLVKEGSSSHRLLRWWQHSSRIAIWYCFF